MLFSVEKFVFRQKNFFLCPIIIVIILSANLVIANDNELAKTEQIEAPEKLVINITKVRRKGQGFLWGATGGEAIEIEARVIEVERSKAATLPGANIKIYYDRPAIASTSSITPPPVPKRGETLPAFLVKRGNRYYPVAHHLSFTALTDEQRKRLSDLEQMKALRVQREERLIAQESNILNVSAEEKIPQVTYSQEITPKIETDLDMENKEIEDIAVAYPSENSNINVDEMMESSRVFASQSLSKEEEQKLEENNFLKQKLDAEMIVRNEARRRRELKMEQDDLAKRLSQYEAQKRRSGNSIGREVITTPDLQPLVEIPETNLDQQQSKEVTVQSVAEVKSIPPATTEMPEIIVAPVQAAETFEEMPTADSIVSADTQAGEPDASDLYIASSKPVEVEPIPEIDIASIPMVSVQESAPKEPEAVEENMEFIHVPNDEPAEPTSAKSIDATPSTETAKSFYEPDDRRNIYKKYFSMIQEGEMEQLKGNLNQAKKLYEQAIQGLNDLKKNHPEFYPEVVKFRLQDTLIRMEKVLVEEQVRKNLGLGTVNN